MKSSTLLTLLLPFLIPFAVFSQLTISGSVSNQNGEKLSFATVFLEGTSFAATTDPRGNFIITGIPSGEYNLKITYIGYQAWRQKINLKENITIQVTLLGEIYNLDQIEIQANKVSLKAPFTRLNLDKHALQKENTGVDVPFLLQWTPSMVVTSDAGTGIGYTGLRLRGSDQTRVNVTINGVPLNDAESHNVFWVDLPDLMGSVKDIQIQRGVGTSTNGAGAFGGTISINTQDSKVNPYLELAGTLGSFATNKVSVKAGTGLINDRYTIDGRYSLIRSNGFVDRASADLQSMSFSAARLTGRSSLRLNILHGSEVTYQAWYGVPQARIQNDSSALLTHYYNNLGTIYKSPADSVNLFSSGRSYNYYQYPQQVDNYRQTHFQLIHAIAPTSQLKLKTTLFYTRGKGYYEEFRYNDKLENYTIPTFLDDEGNQVTRTDLVRRRWLDNHFTGILADAEYTPSAKWQWQAGISANRYFGSHFGNVISSTVPIPNWPKDKRYYDNNGNKTDGTAYLRAIWSPAAAWQWHADVQGRFIRYDVSGIDNDLRNIDVGADYQFFNPKLGVTYQASPQSQWYLSFALAHKEPIRSDFIDNAFGLLPSPEVLHNWEGGFRYTTGKLRFESGLYLMDYRNQLVLTGEINDVGAPVRVNVPQSYRLGLESSVTAQLSPKWSVMANTTLSRNKIASFDEVIADYTNGFEKKVINHTNTDISFSPSWVGTIQLLYRPFRHWETELSSRWVSSQYLDNTSDKSRQLPAYSYQNLRITWQLPIRLVRQGNISLFVNNLFNSLYSSNGYTYTYIYGSSITENFLYPQAGRHVMCTFTALW